MTIGIGMLASEGVVIAADSQVTTEIKYLHGKVTGMFKRQIDIGPDGSALMSHPGGLAISIAGDVGYAVRAAEAVKDCFEKNVALSGDELRLAFETALREHHDAYIAPYVSLPSGERPSFELLIAVSRDNHEALWRSYGVMLSEESPFGWVGIGANQASPMLSRLFKHPFMNAAQTIVTAAFIVHQVKETNVWCGKLTDVMCVLGNHMFMAPRWLTKQMDAVFSEHEDVLAAATMWAAVDALDKGQQSNLRKARRAVRSLVDLVRRDVLLEMEQP